MQDAWTTHAAHCTARCLTTLCELMEYAPQLGAHHRGSAARRTVAAAAAVTRAEADAAQPLTDGTAGATLPLQAAASGGAPAGGSRTKSANQASGANSGDAAASGAAASSSVDDGPGAKLAQFASAVDSWGKNLFGGDTGSEGFAKMMAGGGVSLCFRQPHGICAAGALGARVFGRPCTRECRLVGLYSGGCTLHTAIRSALQ